MGTQQLPFADLTSAIIQSAYQVYNEMGFGFLESVYENCLLIDLRKRRLQVENQVAINVSFRHTVVGHFVADLLVENTVIVELKSVRTLLEAHEVQLVNYLVATSKPVGLLLNFGPKGVEIKRKVPFLPSHSSC